MPDSPIPTPPADDGRTPSTTRPPTTGAAQARAYGHEHVTWLTADLPPDIAAGQTAAWPPRRGRWAVAMERVALAAESVVNRLTSPQYNPLYHTGTIAFFLLLLIGLTGLYLFFFFQYGYDASYAAVARMESQFIARTIRAIHRYASSAVVFVTLLHAYRTLFLEKFRGPRWLAWLTGVVLTGLLWLAGVTGYWLIWDERAVLINDAFRRALAALTPWNPAFMAFLSGAAESGRSWLLFLVILAVHVILFLVAIGFFYLHIVRLHRPKWLPPMTWLVGIGGLLLVAGLLFPVGLLPAGDLSRLPGDITFDPIFLFFLPFPEARWLWLGLLVVAVVAAALPWLLRGGRSRRAGGQSTVAYPPAHPDGPRVRILADRCTGCTLCAIDCPYGALEMIERDDGRPHKYLARPILDRCVGCGICVGSCDVLAVTLGEALPEQLWGLVAGQRAGAAPTGVVAPVATAIDLDPAHLRGARVVFTCERHAAHGARPYLDGRQSPADGPAHIVVLPCIGAAPPDLLGRALEAGAASVRVVGCPPDDCANREGNTWAEQRLTRQRLPRLRRPFIDAPVTASWLPPDAFGRAFESQPPRDESGTADYAAARSMARGSAWPRLALALGLLAAALLAQIWLTDRPLRAYSDRPAVVQLVAGDLGAAFGDLPAGAAADDRFRLELWVDGQEQAGRVFTAEALLGRDAAGHTAYFHELTLPPGEHDLLLRLIGEKTGDTFVLLDERLNIAAGEVARPPLSLDAPLPCPPGLACAQ